MKQFDFNHPDFARSNGTERQAFYLANHDKPVTLEQFIAVVASWPKRPLHNSKARSASAARHDYKRLVNNFGFFPGGQNG